MKSFIKKLPLIGPLLKCRYEDYKHSFVEVINNLFWSSMPIWLGGIIIWLTGNPTPYLGDALVSTIKSGELFIYSTAMLAPIFYMALYDRPGLNVFPSKMSHIVLVAIVLVVSAVIFGLGRAGTKMNEDLVFDISVYMFFGSIILIYLATLYHSNRLPSPSDEMKMDEENFADSYFRHRS